jgi:N,N-dimethylformamidase
MTGPAWVGNSTGWTDAPDQYNAIAFHRDDLSDARWPVTFSFEVPADMTSGAYGFEIRGKAGQDTLPFFVTARQNEAAAPLAFVVPLFSYLAYANERHWWTNPAVEQIAGAPLEEIIGPLERWGEAEELLSLYDYHSDGTGNAHASLRRPLVNMRADYKHPLLRGPHQLSGDILTLEWLRSIGQPVDILTDYCLHQRGDRALAEYRCVMTGSHPEYASTQLLNAFEHYVANGGNLLHMGGNAFYFVVSLYEDEPYVMEVRRGMSGTIPWQSEPGESRQAATGELSGLWRWRGRSAHRLVGTGTSVVSFGQGRPFVRTNLDDKDSELNWIFEGIDTQEIHAHGYLFGGPAGFEMDAMRYDLGTPAGTVKLAVADGFGELSFQALEDVLGTGPMAESLCHMTYRKLHSGGQIFSAPSISWTSCLNDNGGKNDVARITQNVLHRFLAPEDESN